MWCQNNVCYLVRGGFMWKSFGKVLASLVFNNPGEGWASRQAW